MSSGGGGSPCPRPLLSLASSRASEFSGRAGRETPSRQQPTAVMQADCASSSSGRPWVDSEGEGGYSATEAGRLRPTFSQEGGAWWGVGVGRSCLFLRHSKRSPLCPGAGTAASPPHSRLCQEPAQAAAPQTRRQGAGKTDSRTGGCWLPPSQASWGIALPSQPGQVPGSKPRSPGMVGGSERRRAS